MQIFCMTKKKKIPTYLSIFKTKLKTNKNSARNKINNCFFILMNSVNTGFTV